jgi:hypothetical protein
MIMAMQRRNSAQNYYYFGLLLVGVVFSAVSRRLEPLLVVLPLVIALLQSLNQDMLIFSVRCQMTPLRLKGTARRVTIRAETDAADGDLASRPSRSGLPRGRHRVLLALQKERSGPCSTRSSSRGVASSSAPV